MEKEKLEEIIANDGRWLRDEGGKRADLSDADLREAFLRGVSLREPNLPVGVYQIVGPGSRNRCTTYDVIDDQIVCGCWNDGKGNHLDSFIKRIEEVYGPKGENPDSIHYAEYMSAVAFFKAIKGCFFR